MTNFFVEQTGTANPFNSTDIGDFSRPAFADIDGDGDLDAIIGEEDGILNYYRNTGSSTAPVYTLQTGTANPFNGVDIGFGSRPTFADIDGDGDLDALIGQYGGTLDYYKNTGSSTNPVYTLQTGAANPFNGVDIGFRSAPTFADIDGDGDLDAIIGEGDGILNYYRNTGSSTAPVYTLQTGAANPFNGINVGSRSTPSLVDIDGDGDLDALIGEQEGILNYYRNTGSSTAPVYTLQTGAANPFNGVDIGVSSSPTFADLNGDGELDAIIGESLGTLKYFLSVVPIAITLTGGNTQVAEGGATDTYTVVLKSQPTANVVITLNGGTQLSPNVSTLTFTSANWNIAQTVTVIAIDDTIGEGPHFGVITSTVTSTDTRFNGLAIAPIQVSITDNDLPTTPRVYAEQTGTANPFNGIDIGNSSSPTLADLDEDGDLDALIGEYDGNLNYYKNTGSSTAPVYTEQTGTANPFNGIDIGLYSASTLADIDGDGDLDAIIGERYGILRYYRNTGSSTAPVYTEQTGTANPFDGIDIGFYSTPTLADIDGDGDLDAIIGERYGTLRYYRNTGSSTAPVYTEQTGTANPFNGIDIGALSAPSLADLDGDGDLDAIIGKYDGTLNYFLSVVPNAIITLTGGNTQVTEGGATDTYTVVLKSQPAADVVITLNGGMQLSPNVSTLTFTAENWNIAQTVTVTAINDTIGEGPHFGVITSTVTSTDTRFNGLAIDPVQVSITDNDLPTTPRVYAEQTGTANPFNGIDIGLRSAPTFADIDGDGDLDAIIGGSNGNLNYYRNTGSSTAPVYTEQTGTANPFNGIDIGFYSTPSFADIDGDGDLDAIIGEFDGFLNYYQNTGSSTNPVYTEQTGTANPFNGIDIGNSSKPTFADLDADADLDAIIGKNDGTLKYYQNTGSSTNPVYTEQSETANPFNGIDIGSRSTPTFADLDGDGDLDAIIGEFDGNLNYFLSVVPIAITLTGGSTQVTEGGATDTYTVVLNGQPTGDVVINLNGGTQLSTNVTTLTFTAANWNIAQTVTVTAINDTIGEGTQPGVITSTSSSSDTRFNGLLIDAVQVTITDNDLPTSPRLYTEQTGTANPFNGISVGDLSSPTFADIDSDGDLDAIIGGYEGILNYYQNTGSSTAPVYTGQTGTANPFNGINVGFASSPTFADIDSDGDLDALIGEGDGLLNYYQNTGSSTAPVYTEQTGTANPFNGIDIGIYSSPTFADIDGDGDLDALIGEYAGILNYYQNTGNSTAPVYTEQTGTANPFNVIDVGSSSRPTLADIDGDGDLDALIGEYAGILNYYQNTGNSTAPVYTEQTGTANPFNGIDIGIYSSPTLADIDGDGDLDAIVGAKDGNLNYYQSVVPNSAPTAVSAPNASLAENSDTTNRVKVADITVTDDGLGTNILSLSGTDASFFEADETGLYVKAGTNLNFEAQSSYAVTVNVDDNTVGSTPDASTNFTLMITDVNEAPTAVTLQNTTTSLAENTSTANRIKVADIAVTDDGLGTNSLSVSGTDSSLFEADATGLYIKAGTVLDFETKSNYQVTVNVDDATVGNTPDAIANFSLSLLDRAVFSINDVSFQEGLTAQNFTVTAIDPISDGSSTATVNYATANGTAIAGYDYTAQNGVLTFSTSTGTNPQTISIPITDDTLYEPINETFNVNLTNPSSNATINKGQGRGTIIDNDLAIGLSARDSQALEGNSGNTSLIFQVDLSGASGQTVTVNYTVTDGTATTADNDYVVASGTLSFNPGLTANTIAITVKGDATIESNETLTLTLSNAVGAGITKNTATGTIVNDDAASSIVYTGTSGNDTLRGNSAAPPTPVLDELFQGLGGNDNLFGYYGNNTFEGGSGADSLYGLTGQDTFLFPLLTDSILGSADTITRFNSAENDRLKVGNPTALPANLFNVGTLTATSLANATSLAYGAADGNTGLDINEAVFFKYGSNFYLSVNNNSSAAFDSGSDLLLKFGTLVGTPAIGTLTVGDYFAV